MTSKEFKKISYFRSTAERNCYNCKYCHSEMNPTVSPYTNSPRRRYCINDLLENGKCKFLVTNFSICDNWIRDKNKYSSCI